MKPKKKSTEENNSKEEIISNPEPTDVLSKMLNRKPRNLVN